MIPICRRAFSAATSLSSLACLSTVVEFTSPTQLIEKLFGSQCKPEDGCLSHGLGGKGGKGLARFNASLESGEMRWRIVLVKRSAVRIDEESGLLNQTAVVSYEGVTFSL